MAGPNDVTKRLLLLSACLLLQLHQLTAQVDLSGSQYDLDDYKHHPCNRVCEYMAPPRLCEYTWVAESYWTLSKACYDCPFNQSDCSRTHCVAADGVSRGLSVINRMLPGPSLEVCEGDLVSVKVINDLSNGEGTSIHWHGLLQRGTPYMDGVSMLTQCPIPPKASFTYKFRADDVGTHYWHGHSGMQRADGMLGPIVVRRPAQTEPHHALYDHDLSEHVILVNDWLVEMTQTRFIAHHHDDGDNKPELMLINGKGVHEAFVHDDNATHYTPRATFTVQPGQRYRFRVISGAILNCPIQVSVDGHTLTMIASDGNSFEPFVAESFIIFAGERYDFVLFADKTTNLRNYWIRARGLADCSVKKAHQEAILYYAGAPDDLPTEPTDYAAGDRAGMQLNPWNTKASATRVQVSRMRAESLDGNDGVLTSVPDKKFFLGMDFSKIDSFQFNNPVYYPLSSVVRKHHLYSPQMNRISSRLPPSPPLSQYDDVDQSLYCNTYTVQKHCDQEWCSCIHKLDVELGDLVELIVVDEGVTFNANHPMHLHGYKFRLVAMDKVGTSTSVAEVKALDDRGEIIRSTTRAPEKDTVTVPDGGYVVLRFRADNPGIWYFHCHIEYHLDIGMSVMIQVGDKTQFPPVPRHFPKCGSWNYEHSDDDDDDNDHANNDDDDESNNAGSQRQPTVVVQCGNAAAPVKRSFVVFVSVVVAFVHDFMF